MSKNLGGWVYCEKCQKKLLRRLPNGIFVFKFGRTKDGGDVVHIELFGSIKIRCFREECGHTNLINFFPG